MMDNMVVNTTAAREHVGDIERSIRSIKDWGRCTVSELPYNNSMPDQIVIHLLYFVVFWMNSMPPDSGISEVYSPHEIVSGMKLDLKKLQCKVWCLRRGKLRQCHHKFHERQNTCMHCPWSNRQHTRIT
jgi:hypothetical protein